MTPMMMAATTMTPTTPRIELEELLLDSPMPPEGS
jgi:hypothetical protein